jgi:hypothetical protein
VRLKKGGRLRVDGPKPLAHTRQFRTAFGFDPDLMVQGVVLDLLNMAVDLNDLRIDYPVH